MDATSEIEPTVMENVAKVERTSDRELVVTRTINGPARLVFEAWTKPELFRQWWVPKSLGMTLLSCEMDVRVGGGYRLEFDVGAAQPVAFFGRYIEVTPHSRLAWSNDEDGDGGSVTTVTFEEQGGKTLLVMHELPCLEGIPRRRPRVVRRDRRDVRATGRAARHPGRERPTVVRSSIASGRSRGC